MVARGGFGEQRKLAVAPVELARVNNYAADGGAVAANPFGRALHHDVGSMVDGAHQVARRPKGVIDN